MFTPPHAPPFFHRVAESSHPLDVSTAGMETEASITIPGSAQLRGTCSRCRSLVCCDAMQLTSRGWVCLPWHQCTFTLAVARQAMCHSSCMALRLAPSRCLALRRRMHVDPAVLARVAGASTRTSPSPATHFATVLSHMQPVVLVRVPVLAAPRQRRGDGLSPSPGRQAT